MNATHAMPVSYLTLLVLELNAELDTGKYDSIGLDDVKKAIQSETVVPWLRANVPGVDVSLLSPEDIAVYHNRLARIYGGYAGNERRKWGVQNRGLCLLLAWTNEIVQQELRGQTVKPID